MAKQVHRPGEIVPVSGQYGVVDRYGSYMGRQITAVKYERFPPTRAATREYGYVLADVTQHLR